MNLHHHVVADIAAPPVCTGVISAGERNPEALAALRQ
jgi:hypothetical protein